MKGKKEDLRLAAVRQRELLSPSEVHARSQLIQEAAIRFSPYVAAPAVALYSSTGNEVLTDRIRDHAFMTGKAVYYPTLAAADSPALVRAWSAKDLKPGRFGILEPVGDHSLAVGEGPVAIFVPGLFFDLEGHRLGRGKGWYDRLFSGLKREATVIALAYEFQVIDDVPVGVLDRKVHHIITESRIIDCRTGIAVGLGSGA